jgi:hypothetical protein
VFLFLFFGIVLFLVGQEWLVFFRGRALYFVGGVRIFWMMDFLVG